MPFDPIGYHPEPPPSWRPTPTESTRRQEWLMLIGMGVAAILFLLLVLFPGPLIVAADIFDYLANL